MSSKVLTEVIDHIFVITISRPEKRNCVDGETAALLTAAWKRFRDDEALWVAILTGAGEEAFCAGADLTAIAELGPGLDASPSKMRQFIAHGEGYLGYTRQTDIYKPILCAINGHALAGGLELACLGDIRIVEEHAEMGVACRRFNVPLVDGGTQRLPRIVGMGRAMELILTGRFIKSDEALRIGLANEIVPRGASRVRTIELAQRLCELPQGAMRSDKQAALMGWGRPLEEGLRIEAELGQYAIRSRDIIEGALSFAQKRKPNFTQDD
ncbi:enoyl-CoA hydratase-related protein [Pendulispora brunnea]|uniref:Enoyl-CoA hydratase-related protein n=1 Tax=Pendulispora brunnea TaxID=2905690 RepID=A0ABZ2KHI0_9BACT